MAVSTPSGRCPTRKVVLTCRSGTSSGSSSSSSHLRRTSWCCSRSFADLFRDPEVSGVMKAVWVICLVFFTFITAVVYLIVRGRGMNERAAKKYEEARAAQEDYVRSVAGTGTSASEQIAKAEGAAGLGDLHRGVHLAQGEGAGLMSGRGSPVNAAAEGMVLEVGAAGAERVRRRPPNVCRSPRTRSWRRGLVETLSRTSRSRDEPRAGTASLPATAGCSHRPSQFTRGPRGR